MTRIFRRDKPVKATENPYIDYLRILTIRISLFNLKFIQNKILFVTFKNLKINQNYDTVRASRRTRLHILTKIFIKEESSNTHLKQ